jgi:hypothetical protein
MSIPAGTFDRLKRAQTLELNLSSKELTDTDVIRLAKELENNHSLLSLDLSDNPIGDKAAQALANMLRVNHSLAMLDLHDTEIGDKGAEALADALVTNRSIVALDIGETKVRANGINAFGPVLEKTPVLMGLNFSGNDFRYRSLSSFEKGLQKNRSLVELGIDNLADESDSGRELKGLEEAILASRNPNLLSVDPPTSTLQEFCAQNRATAKILVERIRSGERLDKKTLEEIRERFPAVLALADFQKDLNLSDGDRVAMVERLQQQASAQQVDIPLPGYWQKIMERSSIENARTVFIRRDHGDTRRK